MSPEAKGTDVLKALFDMIAYSNIAKRIDKGETEFRVTRDMMADDNMRDYWEEQVPDVLMLAVMAEPDCEEGK